MNIVAQRNIVKKLKEYGTTTMYPRPSDNTEYKLKILVLENASKRFDYVQLGILVGLFVRSMRTGSIYYVVSWISHKSNV